MGHIFLAFQVLANGSFLLKTSATGLRPDLRSVLRYLLQRDQPFFVQRGQHLGEQFIQLLLLFHAEIRQCVVVHFQQSREPLEGWIIFATARHFAR